jgi:predicted DNA-binding transcriptional regulator YafY
MDESPLLAGPIASRPLEVVDLAEVRRCIREQRKARIAYADGRGHRTERVIWPIAVGFFERVRVVLAWCEERRDYRNFRADRISAWAGLRERIGRPRTALLAEWRTREGIPSFGP